MFVVIYCTFWVEDTVFVVTVKYCVLFSIWVYIKTLDGNILHPTGDSVTLNTQKHNSTDEAFR